HADVSASLVSALGLHHDMRHRPSDCFEAEESSLSGRLRAWVGSRSETYSISVCMICLGLMYSVHNLVAPNMTSMAKMFHFNAVERDEYLGGELTLVFYAPGMFVALLVGLLSAVVSRKTLLTAVVALTALATMLTFFAGTFRSLLWARAVAGLGIGGALPVAYSMVGDWFAPDQRAVASAMVTAACGVGVFLGQVAAAYIGKTIDWRWAFLLIPIPALAAAALCQITLIEPVRGAMDGTGPTSTDDETTTLISRGPEPSESAALSTADTEGPLSYRGEEPTRTTWLSDNVEQLKQASYSRTNLLVLLQAFPGGIPWGIIIVYLHDFLVQDMGFSIELALFASATMGLAGFCGVLIGGFIGEKLYRADPRYCALFCAVMSLLRVIPFFAVFGWTSLYKAGPSEVDQLAAAAVGKAMDAVGGSQGNMGSTEMLHMSFFGTLFIGGVIATTPAANLGAILLNVNPPQHRGTVFAVYSVLDDLSKGVGTLLVSLLIPYTGGRAVAYQFTLMVWLICGLLLIPVISSLHEDELYMQRTLREQQHRKRVNDMRSEANSRILSSTAKAAASLVETVTDQRAEQCPEVVVYDDTLELPVSPTTMMASQGYTFTVTEDTSGQPGQEQISATVVESNRPSEDAVEEIEEVSDGDSVKSGDVEITSTAAEPSMVGTPDQADRVTPMSNPMPVELLRTAAALRASQSDEQQQPQTSQAPVHALTPEGASFAMAACSGISLSSMNSGKSEDESPVVPTVAQTIMTMTSGVQPGATGPAYQAADEAGSMMPIDAGELGQLPLGLAEVSAQFDIGFVQQGPDVTEEDDAVSTEEVTEVVDETAELEPSTTGTQSDPLTEKHFPYMYDRMPSPPTTRKFPYLYDTPQLADSVEDEAAGHCNSATRSSFGPAIEPSVPSRKFPYLYDHPEGPCSSPDASTSVTSRKFPYLYDHPVVSSVEGPTRSSLSPGAEREFPYLYAPRVEGTTAPAQGPVQGEDANEEPTITLSTCTESNFPYLYDTCSNGDVKVLCPAATSEGPQKEFGSTDSPMESRRFPYLYDKAAEKTSEEGCDVSNSIHNELSDRKFPYLYDHTRKGAVDIPATKTTQQTAAPEQTTRAARSVVRE
ncbi:hypothetical protein FOL47_008333, partial [Perkinsus chesapeaki]